MRRAVFTFAFFLLVLFAGQAAALETGSGSYQFLDVPSGKTMTIWYYKPASFSADTPVVISLHGMSRNAQGSRNDWQRHADKLGIMVLAPDFNRQLFSGASEYNLGNVFRRPETEKSAPAAPQGNISETAKLTNLASGVKNPPALWSFRLPDAIFDDFKTKREKSRQTRYYLFGHSAGGQFVHRQLLLLPKTKAKMVIAANSGWYTMPDLQKEWPIGVKGMGVTDKDLRRYLSFPLVILLGEKDNDPNHYQLDRSPDKMFQGDSRFSRGQFYYANGQALAEKLKVPFGWSLRTVPNVAHSNGGMVDGAAIVVAEDINKTAANKKAAKK